MILVVVDSHSGWIEPIPVKSATAEVTVVHLRDICARFGLPTCIVTDNGITFTGAAFQEFVKRNGIRHMRTASYHPQPNGLAERAVRSVKKALKQLTDGPLEILLQRWLHNHRRAPSAAHAGMAPAEMLFNFLPRSRLDIIKAHLLKNQKATQQDVDSRLKPGAPVYVRKQCDRPGWMPGILLEGLGSRIAKVQTAQGIVTRHLDQMRTQIPRLPKVVQPTHPTRPTQPMAPQMTHRSRQKPMDIDIRSDRDTGHITDHFSWVGKSAAYAE
ncbi:uncharacterized protein K02A2.6-like [Ornithodoros turicata]|uniref:uncharacterized protein K02A2.6-like n=1 Tax=Ornithodoros turicata TaxID=34597 RepID=UPI003139A337